MVAFRTRCLLLAACVGGVQAACGPGQQCDKNKWMMILHGCFMAIGWTLLALGATIAMFRKYVGRAAETPKIFKDHPSFYAMHRNLQMLGAMFVTAGFVTIYFGMEKVWGPMPASEHFKTVAEKCEGMWANNFFCFNPHAKLGFAIFILMWVQVVFGIVHHLILARFKSRGGTKWVRPIIPSYLHVYLGWTLIFLALLNCAFGVDFYAAIFPYGSGEMARTIGVPLFLGILGITVLVNLYEQIGLWIVARHCCPFKDGDNAVRFFPVSADLDSTPLATGTEMTGSA